MRSSQRLAAVPRPGFAGPDAKGGNKIERNKYSKVGAMKRSAFGWIIHTRSLRSLPPNKGKAVKSLWPALPGTDSCWFIPHRPQGPSSPGSRSAGASVGVPNPRTLT